jgi:hypothetical protein
VYEADGSRALYLLRVLSAEDARENQSIKDEVLIRCCRDFEVRDLSASTVVNLGWLQSQCRIGPRNNSRDHGDDKTDGIAMDDRQQKTTKPFDDVRFPASWRKNAG